MGWLAKVVPFLFQPKEMQIMPFVYKKSFSGDIKPLIDKAMGLRMTEVDDGEMLKKAS
jgi:hypothetical protein